MTSTKSKEIADEYISSLSDLTINSKPLIDMLTMLAEDNVEHAATIVQAVENHLQKVRSDVKLPVLYLIDSIVKNVNGAYLKLFTENIVNTFCSVFEEMIPTAHVVPSTESALGKPVAPVVPSQATKQVEKQFPAATASLLKNAGTNNGPRIAPASSLLVASATRSMSRDPRVKSACTSQEQQQINMEVDPRLANTTSSALNQTTSITTVLSDQLKQQLITKQAVTSTINKPALNNVIGDVAILNASNTNNNSNHSTSLNINNNNKTLSGNTSKDAVLHRSSQKKDPRSSSNNSGNLNNNSSKLLTNQLSSGAFDSSFFAAHSGSSGGGNSRGGVVGVGASGGRGSEAKSKEPKNMTSTSQRSSSSLSGNDKSSTSSKSSHRKLGSKSRSKQPQMSSNKKTKLERDSSPIRSKSREKDSSDGSSSTSSRTSPQSSSQLSKSRTKSGSKSRKRSLSPTYRIPRRNVDVKSNSSSCLNNSNNAIGGLTEEEQSGSLIVSPPHPPAFKEIRPNARQRNYIRRNKESGDVSPDHSSQSAVNDPIIPDSFIKSASKDEDLRPVLPAPGTTIVDSITQNKHDLDLRILPPVSGKRSSTDHIESLTIKKSKAEKFDALFGNEDVDLRTLTNPKAGRPPTPPPPVISGDDNKASWAKIKTPTKSEREKPTINDDKRDRDRNKDRVGRTRLYNNKISDDTKDRRRLFTNDDDQRPGRRSRDMDKSDRHSDRNIEIIMKQAEEQLNQGSISKDEYHTLIQKVWQMNEDQKLRVAQRKERETGSIIWEKNLDIGGFGLNDGELGHRGKDHLHNRNGPRWQTQPWQQPTPWAHPPTPSFGGHFPPDYRMMGPWQNSRQFGPLRPDFNQFHGFNSGMPPGAPRMGPSLLGPMGHNGPMIPSLMANGPLGPIGLPNPSMTALNGPPSLLLNGPPHQPHSNLMNRVPTPTRNISPDSIQKVDSVQHTTQDFDDKTNKEQLTQGRELPLADLKLLSDISNDTMKSINIDGIPREIRYYGQTGVVFMSWDEPREIGFQDGLRRILIDDKDTIICGFNDPYKEFIYDGEIHKIRLGAPTRELYVDDKWYECYFGGPPIKVDLGNKKVNVKLEGPPPQVKIGNVKRTDLVIAKINLIINARNMVPVFLDAKPQMFEIDGQPQTLEFTDALETVLLNGRPFKVEFGGLPKPIIVRDKKHFIRFSVLPRGVRAGHVKISGMKGERLSSPPVSDITSIDPLSTAAVKHTGLEQDSMSQDTSSGVTPPPKSDFQLDMLSSAVSSAMAPSSGLSYQAETMEKPPTPPKPVLPLNLNLNELFQRLVETGMVPRLPATDTKKVEEEPVKKEPEIISVNFEKPETLKIKKPAIPAVIYSGMQCSSCGARFAPELATRYSHHLDWHFRQNRREKDSARKAHARPWYYDFGEWAQFEEIEDLEDRAQSWFEMEKQMAETEGGSSVGSPGETIEPSVPTGKDESGSNCEVCYDAFEQFYNEEKEEWHLRPAVTFENKNYHPICLEDHKRYLERMATECDDSFTEQDDEKKEDNDDELEKNAGEDITKNAESTEINETEMETNETENTTETITPPEVADKIVEKLEVEVNPTTETSTDEQLVNNETEPDDDNKMKNNEEDENKDVEKSPEDESELKTDTDTDVNSNTVAANIAEESDVNTNVNTNTDTIETPVEDKPNNSDEATIIEPLLQNIKKEPEDIDEMEWQPDCNIEIKTEPVDPEPEPEDTVMTDITSLVDTTMTAVKSSIDGNVELDTPPAILPAPARIKININKVIVSKEPEEPKIKVVPQDEPLVEENNVPLTPASIKPLLRGRKLVNMPPVNKDTEMSGLCSIM
ncbi:hypothetical protein PV327_004349 [Microctonus hyperodae]|uniref:CID domain-containing protein n=1 Tax=Microctonus hyperodae TaxID=165561 RepID=A0AA39FC85_MICHY|nr:hypothetical protein PV327_004349 [Microctonus hyperodae]